jgi:hypothetical protein
MRIFGLDISIASKTTRVYNRHGLPNPLGVRIADLTLSQAQDELATLVDKLLDGEAAVIDASDPFKRINFITRK